MCVSIQNISEDYNTTTTLLSARRLVPFSRPALHRTKMIHQRKCTQLQIMSSKDEVGCPTSEDHQSIKPDLYFSEVYVQIIGEADLEFVMNKDKHHCFRIQFYSPKKIYLLLLIPSWHITALKGDLHLNTHTLRNQSVRSKLLICLLQHDTCEHFVTYAVFFSNSYETICRTLRQNPMTRVI